MNTLLVVLHPDGAPDGFIEAATEKAALEGAALYALFVVDSVWSRFSGSDWLSTGPSRAQFDAYMRETLAREGETQTEALAREAERLGVAFSSRVTEGDTEEIVRCLAGSLGAEAIIIPSTHPCLAGFRSKKRLPLLVYSPGLPIQ